MKEWWFNLSLNEKQTVSIGVAVIIIGLCYALVWSPLHNGIASLRNQIQHNQNLLSWMQAADKKIYSTEQIKQKSPETHTSASLLSTVQTHLKQSPLANSITQLAQADNDSVKLTFQKVNFDLLISWLIERWQQQGLIITRLTITSSGTPGMVAAEFILT